MNTSLPTRPAAETRAITAARVRVANAKAKAETAATRYKELAAGLRRLEAGRK